MKAELLSNGTLEVTAETSLESYALLMWHQHWSKHEVVQVVSDTPAAICGAAASAVMLRLPMEKQ